MCENRIFRVFRSVREQTSMENIALLHGHKYRDAGTAHGFVKRLTRSNAVQNSLSQRFIREQSCHGLMHLFLFQLSLPLHRATSI